MWGFLVLFINRNMYGMTILCKVMAVIRRWLSSIWFMADSSFIFFSLKYYLQLLFRSTLMHTWLPSAAQCFENQFCNYHSVWGIILEKYCGQLPVPLSYVPVTMGELSDHMTFPERVKNMMLSLFFEFGPQQYDFAFWDQFYSETLGKRLHFMLS